MSTLISLFEEIKFMLTYELTIFNFKFSFASVFLFILVGTVLISIIRFFIQ
jgi:hypothetical protein